MVAVARSFYQSTAPGLQHAEVRNQFCLKTKQHTVKRRLSGMNVRYSSEVFIAGFYGTCRISKIFLPQEINTMTKLVSRCVS